MNKNLENIRFVAKAMPSAGARPSEFLRTMAPHPLSYMELPYDPEYALYNGRMTPDSLNHADADTQYWALRTKVIFRNTGELPIEFRGARAGEYLSYLFPRDVRGLKVGRCAYQFACFHDGGMINDGVLMRLTDDRFWMTQADGELLTWYLAHAKDWDLEIFDPNVWVSQIQGPHSLEVLAEALDGAVPEPFRYFDCAEVTIAGEPCWISRSGFSNELGWEVYLLPNTDRAKIGDKIMQVGEKFEILLTGIPVFRARRCEAGILNAGSDFDATTTPFAAGLGRFVSFDEGRDFIGRSALEKADKACRTWGITVAGGIAQLGRTLSINGETVGQVCSSGYSPYKGCGVGIVRMDDPAHAAGTKLEVETTDGATKAGELYAFPLYDEERLIPRGKLVDIPTTPIPLK